MSSETFVPTPRRSPFQAKHRVALIIGDGTFPCVQPIVTRLQRILATDLSPDDQFRVLPLREELPTQDELQKEVKNLCSILEEDKNSVGLFCFAGHGYTKGGKNQNPPMFFLYSNSLPITNNK